MTKDPTRRARYVRAVTAWASYVEMTHPAEVEPAKMAQAVTQAVPGLTRAEVALALRWAAAEALRGAVALEGGRRPPPPWKRAEE